MKYFPIFLDLEGKSVVVVGGGEPALQKTRLLLKTSARITVIAEQPAAELVELASTGRVSLQKRGFTPADLNGATIAYAATGDHAENSPIAAAARERGVLVNVVDELDASDFLTPALVDRDPVTVAIGTEGASPVLAREIKTHLEAYLPSRLGSVARAAAILRERIARTLPEMSMRRRFWERLLAGPFRAATLAEDYEAAEAAVAAELSVSAGERGQPGRVLAIGCGPGAGDLITLRAQRALQQADTLVIDPAVPGEVLEHARREAKRLTTKFLSSKEIAAMLITEASEGSTVAWLRAGDGRSLDVAAAVDAAGIRVETVPGIAAALASPATPNVKQDARWSSAAVAEATHWVMG